MDKVFANHIDRNLEVYVDDMVIKSPNPKEHIKDLEEIFAQVRKYDMRLNLDNSQENGLGSVASAAQQAQQSTGEGPILEWCRGSAFQSIFNIGYQDYSIWRFVAPDY
ncbi:hypothetical protein CR513_07249, partial [Mucuna pruriens]